MRAIFLAIMMAVGLAASPAKAATRAADPAQVDSLSIDWMNALERKDFASLERMMATEFTLGPLGGSSDSLVPRERWLDNAAKRTFSDFEYRHMRVQRTGESALIFADLQFRASPIPFRLDSTVMDEWVFRDGRWQVRARWLGNSRSANRMQSAGAFIAGVIATLLIIWVRRRRRRVAA